MKRLHKLAAAISLVVSSCANAQVPDSIARQTFSYFDFGGVVHSYDGKIGNTSSSAGIGLELSVSPADYVFVRAGYENSWDFSDFDAGRDGYSIGAGGYYPVGQYFVVGGAMDYESITTTGCYSFGCRSVDQSGSDLSVFGKFYLDPKTVLGAGLIDSGVHEASGYFIDLDMLSGQKGRSGSYVRYTSIDGDSKYEFIYRYRG